MKLTEFLSIVNEITTRKLTDEDNSNLGLSFNTKTSIVLSIGGIVTGALDYVVSEDSIRLEFIESYESAVGYGTAMVAWLFETNSAVKSITGVSTEEASGFYEAIGANCLKACDTCAFQTENCFIKCEDAFTYKFTLSREEFYSYLASLYA